MPLDKSKCAIPKIWCGNGKRPKGYSKEGSRYECLRVGFGAGSAEERNKYLPKDSLRRIKYVGEKMEARFKRAKITTMTGLVSKCKSMSVEKIEKMLKTILVREGGALDGRAFNSVILFLDSKRVKTPQCKKLT